MFEAPLQDFGALARSGAASVPDYATQEAQRQMLALQRQQLQAQTVEAQRQIDQRNAFQADVDQVLTNPTAEGYSRLLVKHPEFADKVKASWGVLDSARQQTDLTQMGEIYSAAANGRYDLAAATLKRRIEADKAADGQADPHDEAMLKAFESGDPVQQKAALGMTGVHLSAVVGPDKFSSTLGQLTKDDEGFTLGPGMRRYDAAGNVIAEVPFAPRPLTVGEGQTIVEYQPGGGGQASGGAGGGGSAPRGVRNNNPGNLKDGPFAKAQPGYKGADPDGFAIFENAGHGTAAQSKLLTNYISSGVNTPQKIVEKYAPAGENSAASRANYAAHVAQSLGIGINDPIPASMAPQLAQAMGGFENGTGPRVIAQGAPKPTKVAEPSATRVVNGQTFVKVNGNWYRKTS